ncbi:MAG: M28 family peptidase [Segetibacter sp.]
MREKGVPWFADVKDWLEENSKNADFDITKTIQKEADRAASKGATALFLYNSSNLTDNLRFNKRDKTPPLSIPVIYITSAGYNKYFMDNSQVLDIKLNVAIVETIKNANNVAGYIDNHAATDIVIATPYDHVYQEENENTADKGKLNESNDVISGTSMLIELARMLFRSKAKNNNYTFIAYSGEDTLCQDSKWLNNYAIASSANYIINLDKVGRYDEDKKLLIEAYGTSPDWIESIKPLADKTLEVNFDSSSIEGRDTSIRRVKTPVLNFLTSRHGNYDQGSSSTGVINYEGELHIARFIYRLIEVTDTKGKLAFLKDSQVSLQDIKTNQAGISAQKTTRP